MTWQIDEYEDLFNHICHVVRWNYDQRIYLDFDLCRCGLAQDIIFVLDEDYLSAVLPKNWIPA